jgi:replication factor A1
MAIKDLQARQGNVDLIAEVIEVSEPKEFNKFGKSGKVANAVLKDATGQVKLSLWNEQIDSVHVGDKVHIKNGFVNEWQGEKQLTTGKFGTLEVLESGKKDSPVTDDESEEAEVFSETPKEKPASQDELTSDENEEAEDDLDEELSVDEEEVK